MNVRSTSLDGVLVLEPEVIGDDRGHFFEAWNARDFALATGFDGEFVQDNYSRSNHSVLRGLHYQLPDPQAKLVRCVSGSIFDVVVDLRASSSTFGKWVGVELSEENHLQMWVPVGFAHGYATTSSQADVEYKTTGYYAPKSEHALAWNDPDIAIEWPVTNPIVSERDSRGSSLAAAVTFP